jgi:hypothetical protein
MDSTVGPMQRRGLGILFATLAAALVALAVAAAGHGARGWVVAAAAAALALWLGSLALSALRK